MKSLRRYIAESEYRQSHPVTGDNFAFELSDGTLLETYIMDACDGFILVDSSDRIFEELKQWYQLDEILQDNLDDSNDAIMEMYFASSYGEAKNVDEAEYHGRNVPLGKPMKGDVKKFKVYVKDPKTGNVKKVNFGHGGKSARRAGQKTMRIKKSNPARRRSFRARHHCENPGPRTKARYWACRSW
jgi:hypothetical protein